MSMKKRKNIITQNYLDKRPIRADFLTFSENEDGIVTLDIENKGLFNTIAQKLFKKPRISHIHLDAFGSFVWNQIDGERSIFEIGKSVDEHFGEKAHPLYERLAKYFQILESYRFVAWDENKPQ